MQQRDHAEEDARSDGHQEREENDAAVDGDLGAAGQILHAHGLDQAEPGSAHGETE